MRSAVIVSTARTPIGRAYRGAFNNTPAPTLAAHSIRAAVERAGIEGGLVDDVVFGAALQQGHQGGNIARNALLRAGLPVSVPGMSVARQCASGLMAIATAAKQIITDNMDITIGGGLSSSDAIPAAVAQQFCTERAHTADMAFFCVSFGSCAVCQDIRWRSAMGLWGCVNNPPPPLRCSTRAADHGENLQNRCVKLLGETDKVVRTQCLICSSL